MNEVPNFADLAKAESVGPYGPELITTGAALPFSSARLERAGLGSRTILVIREESTGHGIYLVG